MRRQPQVQQDHIRMTLSCERQRLFAIARQQHLVLLGQRPFHLGAYRFVVIHQQQQGFRHFNTSKGNRTRNVLPRSGSLCTSIRPPCASTIIRD